MGKWEMVRLGDYIEQIRGVSYKPEDSSETPANTHMPVLRAHNIQDVGLNSANMIYVDKRKIKPVQHIKKGDIVICASSGSKDLVGKAAQAKESMNASFGAFCKVVRPKSTVESTYLNHYFSSPFYRKRISELSSGANINNLRNEHIDDLQIPLPPLPVQQHIADVLDRASALIEKRKVQIDKLDLLIKSQFIEMFGDPVTNPKGWEIKKLSDIFDVGSSKRIYQNELVASGIAFLRISDLVKRIEGISDSCELYISEEQYNNFAQKSLVPKPDDILVTSRGTLGLCYIIGEADRFYFQDGMISWLKKGKYAIDSIYMTYLFQSRGFRKQIDEMPTGSTVNYLSIARLEKLNVMYPDYALQKEFSAFVGQVEAQKSLLQQSLAKLELNYKSLMQKCFRGEIF